MLREIIGDALIIASGIVMTNMFAHIWFAGWVNCGEPNRIILGAELILSIMVVIIGIDRFIDDTKRPRLK